MRFLFAATAIGVLATAGVVSAADCPPVPPPSNSAWLIHSDVVGGTGEMVCNPNYELSGDSRIVCEHDPERVAGSPPVWQWVSGRPATCIPLCPGITPPNNGAWVNVNGNHIGNTGNVECNPGYRLNGNGNIICKSINDGSSASWSWVDGEGSCVAVECPPIPPPSHGSWNDVGGSAVGNTAELLCDHGYTYQNNKNLVCTLNSDQHSAQWKWTNEQQGECLPATCAPIQPPEHGVWAQVSSSNVGATGALLCERGFHVSGNPNVNCKLTSRNEAKWSWFDESAVGSCSKIICPGVQPPIGGTWTQITENDIDIGRTAVLECNQGYTLAGGKDLVCANIVNGGAWKWVDDTIGYCVPNPQ